MIIIDLIQNLIVMMVVVGTQMQNGLPFIKIAVICASCSDWPCTNCIVVVARYTMQNEIELNFKVLPLVGGRPQVWSM